jgi:glutamine phosphoribosylpyrophosphate amidotransferase
MMTRGEFIAKRHSVASIRRTIGADALIYQSYSGLVEAVRGQRRSMTFCTACFDGDYPTGISEKDIARMERDRRCWMS